MGAIVETLEIVGNSLGLQAAAKQAEQSLESAFAKGALAAGLINKAVDAVIGSLQEGIAAADEYHKTTAQLNAALELTGQATAQTASLLDEQANSLESVSLVSDEVVRAMQSQALMMGVSAEKTHDLIRASIGLANATGRDVNGAFESLLRTTGGQLDRTLKLIPAVRDLTEEQLMNGEAFERVASAFDKFVGLETEGPGGAFRQMATAAGNLSEELAKLAMSQDGYTKSLSSTVTMMLNLSTEATGAYGKVGLIASVLSVFSADTKKRLEDALAVRNDVLAAGRDAGAIVEQAMSGGALDFSGMTGQNAMVVAGKKKQKRTEIDFGGLDATMKSMQDAAIANARLMEELDAKIYQGKEDLLMSHLERMAEIEESGARQRLAVQEEYAELTKQAMGAVSQSVNEALVDWAEEGELNGKKFLLSAIANIGQMLIAKGTADMVMAAANYWFPLTFPLAGPGMAAAAVEIATGTAFVAGGVKLGKALGGATAETGKYGGNSSRTGPAAATTGAGAAGTERRFDMASKTIEARPMVINFYGPTTRDEVGVAIEDLRRAVISKGLVN